MDFHILISNLTNPTLLFFVLGIFATVVKSDLEIPASSSKFISLYLLFSIGFKGGQELAHSGFSNEIVYSLLFALLLASLIPLYTFFILKRKLSISDAGAVAAGEYLMRYINARAGTLPAAQWFWRMPNGSGIGMSGIQLPPVWESRTLDLVAFPELFLSQREHDATHQQLINDFHAWQAPWLR